MMSGMMMWMLVWGLVGLAVLAVLVAGIVWFVGGNATGGAPREPEPADVLRRRYAAGEIDEDEYLRRLSGLSQR